MYFATTRSGRVVVVKGPLPSVEAAENAIEMADWKSRHGIPHVATTCVQLVPDRWPEGVALGLRNRIARDQPAPFLVAASLLTVAQLTSCRRTHSSKLWPATEVFDDAQAGLHLRFESLSLQQMKDYVRALLARWVYGTSDLADRNFLLSSGRVYSIDEEMRGHPVSFGVELKSKRCNAVAAWVSTHYASLGVHEWVFASAELAARASKLADKSFVLGLFQAK